MRAREREGEICVCNISVKITTTSRLSELTDEMQIASRHESQYRASQDFDDVEYDVTFKSNSNLVKLTRHRVGFAIVCGRVTRVFFNSPVTNIIHAHSDKIENSSYSNCKSDLDGGALDAGQTRASPSGNALPEMAMHQELRRCSIPCRAYAVKLPVPSFRFSIAEHVDLQSRRW